MFRVCSFLVFFFVAVEVFFLYRNSEFARVCHFGAPGFSYQIFRLLFYPLFKPEMNVLLFFLLHKRKTNQKAQFWIVERSSVAAGERSLERNFAAGSGKSKKFFVWQEKRDDVWRGVFSTGKWRENEKTRKFCSCSFLALFFKVEFFVRKNDFTRADQLI